MSLDNPNGIESSVSKNTKQRRTFLKRASATTLIASLPLKSSWASVGTGCSVSGNLSGNLSHQHDVCTINGLSPGGWHTRYRVGHPHEASNNAPKSGTVECSWNWVFDNRAPFIHGPVGNNVEIWAFLPNVGVPPYSPGGAGENINTALVAAYLNANAGFYGQLIGTPEQYVQGLHDQITSGSITAAEMKAAIESTYN
jgi:hypothetical protein